MIIFVADRPSPNMKPGAKPFEGAACESRLKSWIGLLNVQEYKIINQCEYTYIQLFSIRYRSGSLYGNSQVHYVALGNKASLALKDIPHFKLPHPSFRNRTLNNSCVIDEKLIQCGKYLRSCYEGEK